MLDLFEVDLTAASTNETTAVHLDDSSVSVASQPVALQSDTTTPHEMTPVSLDLDDSSMSMQSDTTTPVSVNEITPVDLDDSSVSVVSRPNVIQTDSTTRRSTGRRAIESNINYEVVCEEFVRQTCGCKKAPNKNHVALYFQSNTTLTCGHKVHSYRMSNWTWFARISDDYTP